MLLVIADECSNVHDLCHYFHKFEPNDLYCREILWCYRQNKSLSPANTMALILPADLCTDLK